PLLEGEGVGEHGGHVDAALLHEVEVVGDAVLAAAVDLFHAEGVGTHDADLFEVQGSPLVATGRADTRDDERPAALEDADADLERVGLAHGVVDDVDVGRMAPRQALPWLTQHAARPPGQVLDQGEARFGCEDGGAQAAGHRLLARPSGNGCHLDVGVQGAEYARGRRAQGAGPVDNGPAAGPGWRAGDGG